MKLPPVLIGKRPVRTVARRKHLHGGGGFRSQDEVTLRKSNNGKLPVNGGFIGKITDKWCILKHASLMTPEGTCYELGQYDFL